MKTVTTLFALFLLALPTQAQDVATRIIETKALMATAMDANHMDGLRQARASFERLSQDEVHAPLAHYYIARIESHLMNLVMQEDEDAAIDYADSALDHLDIATELDEDFAEAYAMMSSILGRKSGLQPMRAMFLGPKSERMMSKALDMEPDNPRILLIDAISLYYKPSMFGGDKDRAREGFERAADLFAEEARTPSVQPTWGHDEVHAWIGLGHIDLGDYEAAHVAFNEALAVNPNYGWVKYVLMPKLEKRMADG